MTTEKPATVSTLIIFPTAKINCACGNRLAPNKTASNRMGMSALARNTRTCDCGSEVIDEVAAARALSRPDAAPAMCACCNTNEASLRIEVKRNDWQGWCLECVEERDEVIAERFGDIVGAPTP